jgi:hypothetical protein
VKSNQFIYFPFICFYITSFIRKKIKLEKIRIYSKKLFE